MDILCGTKVRINGKNKLIGKHLVGMKGIAVARMKNSGYIKVIQEYEGYLTELCYPEESLDIIELPAKL